MSSRRRPWSELPIDLLLSVSARLPKIADYIKFRSVCSQWRSAATPARLPPQFPRLLLPHDPRSDRRAFFDASSGAYRIFDLPQSLDKTVCGSSFGWLALIDADSALSLWNPFTRGEIDLPGPSSLPSYSGFRVVCHRQANNTNGEIISERIRDDHNSCVDHGSVPKGYPWKVSLSAPPGDEGCVVILVLAGSQEFAYCRIRDEKWTIARTGLTSPVACVMFHEGKFYAFDTQAAGLALDPVSGQCMSIPFLKLGYMSTIKQLYVVKRDAELLMVLYYCRFDELDEFEDDEVEEIKARIEIFRIDLVGQQLQWSKIETIGDSALFLSGNHSSIVRAKDLSGCRKNCIYFSSLCGPTTGNFQPGVPYMDIFDTKENELQARKCPWVIINETGLENATWVTPTIHDPSKMLKAAVATTTSAAATACISSNNISSFSSNSRNQLSNSSSFSKQQRPASAAAAASASNSSFNNSNNSFSNNSSFSKQ